MSMNIFEFNNVVLNPDLVKAGYSKSNLRARTVLAETIRRLAPMYPLWQFVALNMNEVNEVDTFKVFANKEELGSIYRTIVRGYSAIAVSNHRISDSRLRGSAYTTKDVDKAVLKVKKMFAPLNPKERLTEARKEAGGFLTQQMHSKHRQLDSSRHYAREAMLQYVIDVGYAGFLAHVQTLASGQREKVLEHVESEARLSMEVKSIEEIRQKFDTGVAALIVRDSGKYLVKIDDNVQIYDDNTLPENMKRNLGMLKLVDAGFFLSGIGCRVNDEVFVVSADEEKEQA